METSDERKEFIIDSCDVRYDVFILTDWFEYISFDESSVTRDRDGIIFNKTCHSRNRTLTSSVKIVPSRSFNSIIKESNELIDKLEKEAGKYWG